MLLLRKNSKTGTFFRKNSEIFRIVISYALLVVVGSFRYHCLKNLKHLNTEVPQTELRQLVPSLVAKL